MQILDLSQVMYSVILADGNRNPDMSIDLVRHMMVNVIRRLNSKFRRDFGPLVIAADSKGYSWRKKMFPLYKAPRKERQKSDDWTIIHSITDTFREELKEFFPYKFVEASGAEADDIIAILCQEHPGERKIIISADKDFIQLHDENTFQYDPVRDKYVKHENPKEYLIEHVLKGDTGDGVPNIYSDDDTFVVPEKRQTVMTAKRLGEAKQFYLDVISGKVPSTPNFRRNHTLISLDMIPSDVRNSVLSNFEEQPVRDRRKLMLYFGNNELRKLLTQIGDF